VIGRIKYAPGAIIVTTPVIGLQNAADSHLTNVTIVENMGITLKIVGIKQRAAEILRRKRIGKERRK